MELKTKTFATRRRETKKRGGFTLTERKKKTARNGCTGGREKKGSVEELKADVMRKREARSEGRGALAQKKLRYVAPGQRGPRTKSRKGCSSRLGRKQSGLF